MVWQVAYLLATEETVSREFAAYDRIRDNFPKYVVSLDELDMSQLLKGDGCFEEEICNIFYVDTSVHGVGARSYCGRKYFN